MARCAARTRFTRHFSRISRAVPQRSCPFRAGWPEAQRFSRARLANLAIISGDALPLNKAVLERARAARLEGRPILLVSAADQRQPEAIAEPLDLFDEIVGMLGGRNLKGQAKADYLVERFERHGFHYIGDARADLPVWSAARRAITVRGRGASAARSREWHSSDHSENNIQSFFLQEAASFPDIP